MKTAIQIFFKQTKRSTKRLVLQLVLMCAVTAFFVVSLNLYSNSKQNLQTVENTYTTIATAEFYGYVTADGKLVHPGDEDCVGRYLLSVEDYDFSPFLALDSVKDVHLRTRVAAYIPGQIPVQKEVGENAVLPPEYKKLFQQHNVIRFVLDAEEPVTYSLRNGWKYYPFPIRILEQSNPLLVYPETYSLGIPMLAEKEIPKYADEIRRLNRSDVTDSITLYPGVEYVMATRIAGTYWIKDEETGKYIWQEDDGYYNTQLGSQSRYPGVGFNLSKFFFYETYYLCYDPDFGLNYDFTEDPDKGFFSIQRYEDVKNDSDWTEYIQAGEYNGSAFTAVLTDDISLVPAWYKGAMFLHEGRMITEEEYKSGAKVCMISTKMAYLQGWKVGDKLDMHLYEYDGYVDRSADIVLKDQTNLTPNYTYGQEGFFDEATYEIVGIFDRKDLTDIGETAEEVFFNPWDSIYIPANSAPNAPEGPVQASLLTFHLKNGGIPAFEKAVEEMGLTEFRAGDYEVKFSYFDRGYSKIQSGLMEMNHNAVLLLALSGLLLFVTMVLMAFLFAQQHKHSAGILRLLGGSKKQTFIAVLACAAAVVLVGGVVGAILGGVLTQSVGKSALGDAAESASVALSTGADLVLTGLSGLGCVVLFLLLTAICIGTYIGKEPRALLPENKG